jgi:hypothetical protein
MSASTTPGNVGHILPREGIKGCVAMRTRAALRAYFRTASWSSERAQRSAYHNLRYETAANTLLTAPEGLGSYKVTCIMYEGRGHKSCNCQGLAPATLA